MVDDLFQAVKAAIKAEDYDFDTVPERIAADVLSTVERWLDGRSKGTSDFLSILNAVGAAAASMHDLAWGAQAVHDGDLEHTIPSDE